MDKPDKRLWGVNGTTRRDSAERVLAYLDNPETAPFPTVEDLGRCAAAALSTSQNWWTITLNDRGRYVWTCNGCGTHSRRSYRTPDKAQYGVLRHQVRCG